MTEFEEQGGNVRFLIHFQGNYMGTVSRMFTESSGGSNSSSQTFVITANAIVGGTITPSGTVRVIRDQTPSFTMRAAEGYRLAAVLVDGKPVDTERTYRFAPVTKNHTISAEFVPLDLPPSPDDTGVSDYLNTKDHSAYVSGYPDGSFGPQRLVTRGEMSVMVNRMLGRQVDQDFISGHTGLYTFLEYRHSTGPITTSVRRPMPTATHSPTERRFGKA